MTKKIFISLLLLLTYSLGFAHNFIPHSHDTEDKEHVVNHEHEGPQHHHHNTSKHINNAHELISHGDHFDGSFYDLLVCFLHDAHQENECVTQHYTPAKTNRITTNKLQVSKLVAILFSITLEAEKSELFSDYPLDSTNNYLSPSAEDTPLRGPPLHS